MTHDDRRVRFGALAAEVYEPLQRYLRRRCGAETAEEVLNDTLLVLWRRLDDVPEHSSLPWCYGVARRCLANHRRAGTRRLRLVQRIGATAPARTDESWTGESEVLLHDALATLPEFDREVVRLWAWEMLEPREIAEVLGATPNAVSVRLRRIRVRLEDELLRQNGVTAGHKPDERHRELET